MFRAGATEKTSTLHYRGLVLRDSLQDFSNSPTARFVIEKFRLDPFGKRR